MTYAGYLLLGGNEIVNTNRVITYARAMGITAITCGECDTLNRALDEPPYTSPDLDDAPWWDPTVAESKDFAGVLGVEVIGLDGPVNSREVIPLARDGAALNPLHRRAREIQVRAYLFARTECALSYGRGWLAAATRGGTCGLDCVGDELCYLSCCPDNCPEPDPDLPDTCGDRQWRTLYNVGILEGPVPQPARKISGGWMQEVTVTFTAGNPFIFHTPTLAATGPSEGQVLPNYVEDPDNWLCVDEATNCVQEAMGGACGAMPPPIIPLIPPDPCFPTGAFVAWRAVIALPDGLTPIWLETVPLIRLRTGPAGPPPAPNGLRRLTLRWYTNPTGLDCLTSLENPDPNLRLLGPCDVCAEIQIPIVPPNSTLTLDGRTERAWVDCPGGPGLATAEPFVYGPRGTAFQWPVFACGQSLCLEIIAQADSVQPGTSWEIFAVAREDAS